MLARQRKILIAYSEATKTIRDAAMRLGKEFHDESDIRFLLRYLNISTYQVAIDLVAKYYPVEQIPQKTMYVLEEILEA